MAASIEVLAYDAPAAVLEGAAQVLARSFSSSGPLDVTRGVTREDWLPMARSGVASLRGNGITLVARLPTPLDADEATVRDSVVGVVLNSDRADELPSEPPDAKLVPILLLLDSLEEHAHKPSERLRELYIWLLAVDERTRGQGVATALLRETVRIARELQYGSIVTEATSSYTRLICEQKLGFVVEKEIEYASFELPNGERPFAELPRIAHERGLGTHLSGTFLRLSLSYS